MMMTAGSAIPVEPGFIHTSQANYKSIKDISTADHLPFHVPMKNMELHYPTNVQPPYVPNNALIPRRNNNNSINNVSENPDLHTPLTPNDVRNRGPSGEEVGYLPPTPTSDTMKHLYPHTPTEKSYPDHHRLIPSPVINPRDLSQGNLNSSGGSRRRKSSNQLGKTRKTSTSSSLDRSPDKDFHGSGTSSNGSASKSYNDNSDDDDSWKICGVCNDKATGYHFNALTCEGCKGFFRRSMKNAKMFICSYSNQCSITKNNRRQCQACRLQKCVKIGMKKECIMSPDQIKLKKTLVLSNRIKRTAMYWTPLELTNSQRVLLNVVAEAFIQSNAYPDQNQLRGTDEVAKTGDERDSNCSSPCSGNSSNFIELIQRISGDLVASAPKQSGATSESHIQHFTDIMEFSIKQVIKFCKKIPCFLDLDLKDQIGLIKAGCSEVLFIKANYTYDAQRKALTLGPNILYTRQSFLQGGMSETYADTYLKFHEDLNALNLDDTEMACLSAIAILSPDRSSIVDRHKVETQQEQVAVALQAYSENMFRQRYRFPQIMSFLPRLRTLNSLCSNAFSQIQKAYPSDIPPLVVEVQPQTETL